MTTIKWEVTNTESGETKSWETEVAKVKAGHRQLREIVKEEMKSFPEFKENIVIIVESEDKETESTYQAKADSYKEKLLSGAIKIN